MLPFVFRVPATPPLGAELVSVEVALLHDPRAVSLRYSNGIKINIDIVSACPADDDPAAAATMIQERIDQSGGVFRLTNVHGIPAAGANPGMNHSAITGRDFPRLGVVF
jgi:hypothetical protein